MTRTWLRRGNLKRETESRLIPVQNNAIRTNYINTKVDNTLENNKCRDIDNHLISECGKLRQKKYKSRHDGAGKVINWKLCKRLKFDRADKWYVHKPESGRLKFAETLRYKRITQFRPEDQTKC